MHFNLLVVTKEKPNAAEIERLMAPYRETDQGGNWDWYQIGGRWTGYLDPAYKPEEDPANIEVCDLCGGTGKRDDAPGRAARAKNPEYNCNGCDGKGKALKWPTQWKQHGGDQKQVSQIDWTTTGAPFAVLKPDGSWEDKGYGDNPGWQDSFPQFIKTLPPEYWVTVVDYHS